MTSIQTNLPSRADLFTKILHSKLDGESRFIRFLDSPDLHNVQQPPLSIEMIAPIACQQACFYCSASFVREDEARRPRTKKSETSLRKSKKERLFDRVQELANIGVKGVIWTGGGDWAVYKWFPELVDFSKSLDIDSMWISHMASYAFSREQADSLITSCTSLRASIDGSNKIIYSKIRQPDNEDAFDLVISNLKTLVDRRNILQTSVAIGAQMVACEENLNDIGNTLKLCEEIGLDYLQVRPIELRGAHVSKYAHRISDERLQNYDQVYASDFIDRLRKTVTSLHLGRVKLLFRDDKFSRAKAENQVRASGRKTSRCAGAHFQAVLAFNADLTSSVRHCYFRQDLETGNVHHGNLKKALYSKERAQMFKQADDTPKLCSSGCKYADFNERAEAFTCMPRDKATLLINEQLKNIDKIVDPNII